MQDTYKMLSFSTKQVVYYSVATCVLSCCSENILFNFLRTSVGYGSRHIGSYYVRLYSNYCLACGCSHITVVNTDRREMDCREPDTACIYYIALLSETSPTIIYILEAFGQRRRNSATHFESGTDIARVRPWNEREGPRQGVQTAEAQFKVAASVRHVRRQIWSNIRPVESYIWFYHYIQPLYVIACCPVELLSEYLCERFSGGLSLTVTTGRHGRVGYCPASYSTGPRFKFRTGHRLFWVFSVFLSPSD